MEFDKHGHVTWTPKALYDLAKSAPQQLVNRYLMTATPWAFPGYGRYCDFLEAVAERTGVHPRNLYLRGSCQVGFSIAPKPTAWTAMRNGPNRSDLDLAIVDEAYFTRFEREIRWWEDRNPRNSSKGRRPKRLSTVSKTVSSIAVGMKLCRFPMRSPPGHDASGGRHGTLRLVSGVERFSYPTGSRLERGSSSISDSWSKASNPVGCHLQATRRSRKRRLS